MARAYLVRPTRAIVTRRTPELWLHDGTLGRDLFAYLGVPRSYVDPSVVIKRHKEAYVDARTRLCLDADGQALTVNMRVPPDTPHIAAHLEAMREHIAAGRVSTLDESGPLAVLATSDHANYYHFLCEDLGRVGFYTKVKALRHARFPVPPPTSWQHDYYRLAGLEARHLPLPKGVWRLRKVWVAPRGHGLIAELHSRAIDWLRQIGDRVAGEDAVAPRPRRIYVSRAGTRHRRLLNEDQVQRLATELGFTTVRPETLPVSEQIRLFRGADVVMGTFGAGLTNALFMRPGALLLEIAPAKSTALPQIHNAIFTTVAGLCDLRYGLLSAPSEGVMPETHDFTVPLDWLRALLTLAQ